MLAGLPMLTENATMDPASVVRAQAFQQIQSVTHVTSLFIIIISISIYHCLSLFIIIISYYNNDVTCVTDSILGMPVVRGKTLTSEIKHTFTLCMTNIIDTGLPLIFDL